MCWRSVNPGSGTTTAEGFGPGARVGGVRPPAAGVPHAVRAHAAGHRSGPAGRAAAVGADPLRGRVSPSGAGRNGPRGHPPLPPGRAPGPGRQLHWRAPAVADGRALADVRRTGPLQAARRARRARAGRHGPGGPAVRAGCARPRLPRRHRPVADPVVPARARGRPVRGQSPAPLAQHGADGRRRRCRATAPPAHRGGGLPAPPVHGVPHTGRGVPELGPPGGTQRVARRAVRGPAEGTWLRLLRGGHHAAE